MTQVSTKHFYFSKFGGYSGLQYVLEQDMRNVENLADGELTQPGTYTVQVDEILSHGTCWGKSQYSVNFVAQDGSHVHGESCDDSTRWWTSLLSSTDGAPLGAIIDIKLVPTNENKRFVAGYLNHTYYLIDPSGQIVHETGTARDLIIKCKEDGVYNRLKGVRIRELRLTQTSAGSETP